MIASLLLLHMTRAMMHTVMLRLSTMDAPSLLHSMLITWAYLTHEMIFSPLLLPTIKATLHTVVERSGMMDELSLLHQVLNTWAFLI